MNTEEYIDNVLREALGKRDGRAFLKDEIVYEAANRIHDDALDMSDLVRRKVSGRLDSILKRKDGAGVRVYGNYSTGSGYRWQTTRSMTITTFRSFVASLHKQADAFDKSLEPLDRILAEMETAGAAVMGEAYDRVIGEQAA